jgi:hypothetical protein
VVAVLDRAWLQHLDRLVDAIIARWQHEPSLLLLWSGRQGFRESHGTTNKKPPEGSRR